MGRNIFIVLLLPMPLPVDIFLVEFCTQFISIRIDWLINWLTYLLYIPDTCTFACSHARTYSPTHPNPFVIRTNRWNPHKWAHRHTCTFAPTVAIVLTLSICVKLITFIISAWIACQKSKLFVIWKCVSRIILVAEMSKIFIRFGSIFMTKSAFTPKLCIHMRMIQRRIHLNF